MIDHFTDQGDNPNNDPKEKLRVVSDFLAATATGLFLVFLAYVLFDSLPLQLLRSDWQLKLVARLMALGSLPLVGLACLHIASILHPSPHAYRQRLANVRQWAIAVAIGFLLLIPLQGFATLTSYKEAKVIQNTQLQTANRRLAPLKQAIASATSTADLQKKISALKDFQIQLQPADLAQPLPLVKKGILDNLARAENIYADRVGGPTPAQLWTAGQSALRTILGSIGYAYAFAAGAQGKNSSLTLLDTLSRRWQTLTRARHRKQRMPY
ncbi:hypothetical protein [Synechococcus sp. CCY 0621]|uniref:hypothetical protein n=1 Tax=Synechococcus sp. CCY 0621 TaxID=2815603 RepID=UPI001C23736B|nr:hypothetical protein [Synechococcus sp. CCY 0621]